VSGDMISCGRKKEERGKRREGEEERKKEEKKGKREKRGSEANRKGEHERVSQPVRQGGRAAGRAERVGRSRTRPQSVLGRAR